MNARDELALILVNAQRARYSVPPRTTTKYCSESCWAEVDAILAAGYSKPRQVSTVEELDALDRGCIVRSDSGELWEKFTNSWDNLSETGEHPYWASEITLPASVLYEPRP